MPSLARDRCRVSEKGASWDKAVTSPENFHEILAILCYFGQAIRQLSVCWGEAKLGDGLVLVYGLPDHHNVRLQSRVRHGLDGVDCRECVVIVCYGKTRNIFSFLPQHVLEELLGEEQM